MSKFIVFFITMFLLLGLCSCNSTSYKVINESFSESENITTTLKETVYAEDTNACTEQDEILGISSVDYPNPYAVSEYGKLNEDQKIAYDALSVALKDILENGPVANKEYLLTSRVSWYDYQLAYNIFKVNFIVAENFIFNFTCRDSLGTQDYVDSIILFDDDHLEEYYQQYVEITVEAEKILSGLCHDGTDEGKAYAIAEWLMNNVSYPPDYKNRLEDNLGSVYTALSTREAICGGFASTFDFLSKKVGLDTICIDSNPPNKEGHVWNMICVDNIWYHIDVTWTDPSQPLRYFMISDEVCYSNHDQAEYYYNPLTLECVIPEAPLCSSYGSMCFGTAIDAWNYINTLEIINEPLRFCFTDIDEMNAFYNYNEMYVENQKKYVFIEKLYGNIMRVNFQ